MKHEGFKDQFSYDDVHVDPALMEILEQTKHVQQFTKWLDAILTVESNKNQNSSDESLSFGATYILGELEVGQNKHPQYDLVLQIAEGGHSGFSERHGDYDYDYLNVRLIHSTKRPTLQSLVVEYIKEQNKLGKYPTKKEIANQFKRRESQVHNCLIPVFTEGKLDTVNGGYSVREDSWRQVVHTFRTADNATKRKMLTEEKDVMKVKQMVGTLCYAGYLSPSSNVPDNLQAIFGGSPWPMKVLQAYDLVRKDRGNLWNYAGD